MVVADIAAPETRAPDMVPTIEHMARAAVRAMTVHERARLPLTGEPGKIAARRETQWRETAAKGDAATFRRRLVEDGFDPDRLAALLGDAAVVPDAPLPGWTDFIRDALAAAAGWDDDRIFAAHPEEAGNPPFYALARPFADHAFERLRAARPELADEARWASLSSARATLIHQLAHHAAPTFNLEFTLYRSRRESGLAAVLRRARGEVSSDLYRAFVRDFFDGRWPDFITEYAVLARQIAALATGWIESVAELFARLEQDRFEVEQQFNGGMALGDPAALSFGLSDRHNGGRGTVILRWASGRRIVYKPKPLDTDLLMSELIDWINASAGLLPMATAGSINRGTHGWQEFIENEPCADAEAAGRFYVRAGYLLALTYALEGYDCHHENLVARGEQPYLIDTETIFNPYKEMDAAGGNAALLANETVYYSVMRTGMLPNWNIRADGAKRDTSGLGGGAVAGNDDQSIKAWVGIGTDDIRLEPRKVPVAAMTNQPLVAGETVQADGHVDAIVAGFRAMYRFLVERRAELSALIGRHKDIQVRFVRKATNVYAQHLWKLTDPKYLRSGIDWSIETDQMARMYLGASGDGPTPWGMLRAEHEAMIDLDIPYFRVPADGLDIVDGAGTVRAPGYFSSGCLERLGHKLDRLDADDLALQERYIACAFHARAARSYHDDPDAVAALTQFDKQPTGQLAPISAEACRAVADEVARELAREAIRAGDGSAAWIALEYLKEADTFQFKPISFNLYSGSMGLAFFLAGAAKLGKDAALADLAAAAIRPVLGAIEADLDGLLRYGTVGGGNGLGSVVYGLASIADFLPGRAIAAEAIEAAIACTDRIDAALLARDRKFDVIFGSAGLLLGLAKLHRVSGDAGVVKAIALTADHLLANRNSDGLVPTYEGTVVTGASHGSSGIALALMRAYGATGDARYREAAMAHVAFEEALFDTERGNYPDYRSTPEAPAFQTAWCHGAPGIGLYRLAMQRITRDPALLDQARRALETAGGFTLDHVDHSCCGNMGRIDMQLDLALATGDAAAIEGLRRDAAYVVERYRRDGSFRLVLNVPGKLFAPGLFTGAAGIAYSLLRLAEPEALPCFLTYD
jgi:type 2 lantibiotic biosynthesis protein LanM